MFWFFLQFFESELVMDYSEEARSNSSWFQDFYLSHELTDLRKDPNYIR